MQPLAWVRWVLCSLCQPWGSWLVALLSCTGLGDKECGEDWGWESVFLSSWPLEVKIQGKVQRMDFILFFKAHLVCQEGGGLCFLPALRMFGQQLALQCWVSPPRESPELAEGQQAVQAGGVGSTAGVNGS